jgi:hypothetical protein
MFRDPDGLVHVVAEAWDIIGERVPVEFSLRRAVENPHGTLPLYLRFACRERGLWMEGSYNGAPTQDVPTCMQCAIWTRP